MNYIDEIFKRADLQQIREFLLHGVEGQTDPRPYMDRVNAAHQQMLSQLRKKYPSEYENIADCIYSYVSTIEDVYTEIGIRVGAMLTAQIHREH